MPSWWLGKGLNGGGLQLVGQLAKAKGQQQRKALDVGLGDLYSGALLGERDAVVLQSCCTDLAQTGGLQSRVDLAHRHDRAGVSSCSAGLSSADRLLSVDARNAFCSLLGDKA